MSSSAFGMTGAPCSGCGERLCDGRCFMECPADYAEPEEGDTGVTLAQLRALYGEPLTEVRGDPLLKRRAA